MGKLYKNVREHSLYNLYVTKSATKVSPKMARILKPYHVLFGFLPQFGLTADIVKETKTSKSLSADELKDTEPGMDRVKRIFKIE